MYVLLSAQKPVLAFSKAALASASALVAVSTLAWAALTPSTCVVPPHAAVTSAMPTVSADRQPSRAPDRIARASSAVLSSVPPRTGGSLFESFPPVLTRQG